MRRSPALFALLVLVLIAMPAATVYYLAYTQSGLRHVARWIPHHVGHLRLKIEGVSGTAVSGMHADRIVIDDRRVHAVFSDVYARITLAPLLWRTLQVPRLTVGRFYLHVRPHGAYRRRKHWHFLPPGLQIRADDVEVAAGTLIVPSGRRIHATRIAAAGLVRRYTTRLDRASLNLGHWHFFGHGRLHAGHPFGMNLRTLVTVRTPGQPTWVIKARGRGNVEKLGLAIRFIEPLQAHFTGRATSLTHDWHWQGRAHLENFDLRPWHGSDTALGHVNGEIQLTGDRSRFTAWGPLRASGVPGALFKATLRGRYANHVITVKRLVIRHPVSGARLIGRGTIGIVAHGPRLELTGTWSRFRWPLLTRHAAVHSPSGRYVLRGIWPYALKASGHLVVGNLNPITFVLAGHLGKGYLNVHRAALAAFGGTAQLTAGSAIWSPRPAWSAVGNASNVDPATLRPKLPGRLTFAFAAAGAHYNARTDFTLAIHHLVGEVRGLSASGSGLISRHRSIWRLQRVHGHVGRNAFAIDGQIDHSIKLHFRIAARHLADLDPHWAGHLRAAGTVSGPRDRPFIDVTASGEDLRDRGVSLASFAARVHFDPRQTQALQMHLVARHLAYRRHHLNIALGLGGPAAHERARLVLTGKRYRLESRATGQLANGVWTGMISSLVFVGAGQRLALDGTSALSVSRRAVQLNQLCVTGKSTRICGAAHWAPGAWAVAAHASGMPLALLTAGWPQSLELRGELAGALSASKHVAQSAQGHLSLALTGMRLLRRRTDGRTHITALGSGLLTVIATPQRLRAKVAVHGGSGGSIAGHLVARRAARAWANAALSGQLTARTALGVWAPILAPEVDRAAGAAQARLTLAGTLAAPRLSGLLDVQHGALDLYRYNFDVRGAHLRARVSNRGLRFNGAARIGAGTAAAQGDLAWHRGAPYGQLHLEGKNLRVVDLPQAVVDASPDLNFKIDGHAITVAGTVRIPHANIAPAALTNAVRVSPDQVIVGESAPHPLLRLQVASHIAIQLGNHVHIATSGLTGRLTGRVSVSTGTDAITRATGQLRIADGSYSAYGRTLDVASGRLIYTGSPIDDPGIDIRAQRTFQDPDVGAAVAGMDVRGTLRAPRITFFSEPPLPQQQIISLVFAGGTLFGGPQLGVSATASTSRNVNAQLIGQGAAVLGSQIGLPLAIEPTYNNDTALVLGKYLSPRLYVSYGITLLQSLNIVRLRYTLGDHWSLSTEFGQLGGADIVYSFEK